MNLPPANETWSLQRMAGLGAALLVGHLGLIWLLGAKAVAPATIRAEGPVFHWINSPLEAPALATALLLDDPARGVDQVGDSLSLNPKATTKVDISAKQGTRYFRRVGTCGVRKGPSPPWACWNHSQGKSTPAATASGNEPQKRALTSSSALRPVTSSTLYSNIATPSSRLASASASVIASSSGDKASLLR